MIKPIKAAAKRVVRGLLGPRITQSINRIRYGGDCRYCPCCQSHLERFLPFGLVERSEAHCPVCGSLERHRLVWMYFSQRTDLFDNRSKAMLHVAPEPQLGRLFRRHPQINYLSADMLQPAMVVMDITDIQYPDGSFDVIYCSHVLEHVPDDRRAMREFYRVLRPGGWAILQVPIYSGVTVEDPSITDPKERERLFGQWDHVRRYGPDYRDRLVEAGFDVKVDGYAHEMDEATRQKHGLDPSENIYFCRKPAS